MTLTEELAVKRALLGMSQEVMASVLDLNEATTVVLDQIPDFIQAIRQLTENN